MCWCRCYSSFSKTVRLIGLFRFGVMRMLRFSCQGRHDRTLFEDSNISSGYQLLAMIEQTPNRNNRITLGEKRDEYDIRRINISWEVSEVDKRATWKALELLARNVGRLSMGRLRVLRERERRIWDSQMGFENHRAVFAVLRYRINHYKGCYSSDSFFRKI